MDDGSEPTSKAIFDRARSARIELHCIKPGKPVQLPYARAYIENWSIRYNTAKSHSALGFRPLAT